MSQMVRKMKKLTYTLHPDTHIRVYDKSTYMDRYTVVIEGDGWEANPGHNQCLGCSEAGRAISQFGECREGRHLGKRVPFESLSEETQRHIRARLEPVR